MVPGYGSKGSKEERNYLQAIPLNTSARLEQGEKDAKRAEQVSALRKL